MNYAAGQAVTLLAASAKATASGGGGGVGMAELPWKSVSLIHDRAVRPLFKQALTTKQTLATERRKVREPVSEAQADAGNYRKGHVRLHGLDISIENGKGSTRSGTSPDGKSWSNTMTGADYGYIRTTEGTDGDSVDVFLGGSPDTELVFVVNQLNPATGKFDEHKVLLGMPTQAEAEEIYLSNYEKGWKGMGEVVVLTIPQFKWWLENGNTKKPIKDGLFAKKSGAIADDDDFWDSPPNKEGRKCPGCDELFKEVEPLPDVEMCETCERFGPPKSAGARRARVRPSLLHKAGAAKEPDPKTVAVDLDGTILTYDGWKGEDHFGKPRPGVRKALKSVQSRGHLIIINTCRGNTDAVKKVLFDHDIPFHYVNENPNQPAGTSDKIQADVYVDDRAIDARTSWSKILPQIERRLQKSSANAWVGKPTVIEQLRAAKDSSDAGNYRRKHQIMRRLMSEYPDQFTVDSSVGNVSGITHGPSGFRLHLPASLLPTRATGVKELLDKAAELELWMAVPGRVKQLYKEARPVAATVQAVTKYLPAMPGYGYVYYHPENHELHAVLGDNDDSKHNRWHNALKAIKGITRVTIADEYHPKNVDEWVRVKKGAAPLGIIGKPMEWAGKLTGGASPLSNAIVGGLLTGGLGYGTGWLLEHLFPSRFVERGRLRKTLGVLGAGVGAMPAAWQGAANAQNASQAGKPMGLWETVTTPHEKVPINERALQGMRTDAMTSGPRGGRWDFTQGRVVSSADLAGMREWLGELPPAPERFVAAVEGMLKDAAGYYNPTEDMHGTGAGGVGLRAVPMDAFNRAIWNDVRMGMTASKNPYGTKSPWGDNTQQMHTPPQLGAATAGLVGGIQSMYGNQSVLSPQHFIRGLATGGVDLVTARIVGGTLGALGGLTPAAQQKLQDMGAWGGLIRGTVGSMLGFR